MDKRIVQAGFEGKGAHIVLSARFFVPIVVCLFSVYSLFIKRGVILDAFVWRV